MSNWYIGQNVVCVEATVDLVKGNIYQIISLRSGHCGCDEVDIHVGHFVPEEFEGYCIECGKTMPDDGIMWYGQSQFAPIEEPDISELLEVLKTETKTV